MQVRYIKEKTQEAKIQRRGILFIIYAVCEQEKINYMANSLPSLQLNGSISPHFHLHLI